MKPQQSFQFSQEQIIHKLESYCAYRERCEAEVRQKLFALNVENKAWDFYLNYLKENNFLNEERFAIAFTRGKFSMKNWGKRKIMQELQLKKIDTPKIRQSIEQIDDGMYYLRLQDLLFKKNKAIKDADVLKRKQKLINFALQKGYEIDLINEALKEISI